MAICQKRYAGVWSVRCTIRATMTGVSERTVQRDWEKARIYLHRVLRSDIVDP